MPTLKMNAQERHCLPQLLKVIKTHLSNTIISYRYILFIIKYQGHDEIAKLLLNNGADVHFGFDGLVPLFLSAAMGKLLIFFFEFIIYIK